MPLITGARDDTVTDTAAEVRPVLLFFTVTLNDPAASVAWPDSCVVLPPALKVQLGEQPDPLNETVLLEASKPVPFSVKLNDCPGTGVLGLVAMLLIAGACDGTFRDTAPEVRPVLLFF